MLYSDGYFVEHLRGHPQEILKSFWVLPPKLYHQLVIDSEFSTCAALPILFSMHLFLFDLSLPFAADDDICGGLCLGQSDHAALSRGQHVHLMDPFRTIHDD